MVANLVCPGGVSNRAGRFLVFSKILDCGGAQAREMTDVIFTCLRHIIQDIQKSNKFWGVFLWYIIPPFFYSAPFFSQLFWP